ncbi:MAG: hypothetical protein LC676_12980 [Loktanella sp.]|nr:hypothetical protein [Loktanella sp.]
MPLLDRLVPSVLRRAPRDAAMVESQLDYLAVWAENAWRDMWHDPRRPDDLGDALAAFLSDGSDHAKTVQHLDGEHSAVIARALLVGIGRSDTHTICEYEAALGVTFPPEVRRA